MVCTLTCVMLDTARSGVVDILCVVQERDDSSIRLHPFGIASLWGMNVIELLDKVKPRGDKLLEINVTMDTRYMYRRIRIENDRVTIT